MQHEPGAGSGKEVDIKDLQWEDKEKLLRILFAKMNGLEVIQSNQSLEPQIGPKPKEIRSYRGAEYPIGPSAFSGSLAERVDRISTIDYGQVGSASSIELKNPSITAEDFQSENHGIVVGVVPEQIMQGIPLITMEE